MQEWQKYLSGSVVKVEDLPFIPESMEYRERLKKVADVFPIRINSYFLNQIKARMIRSGSRWFPRLRN